MHWLIAVLVMSLFLVAVPAVTAAKVSMVNTAIAPFVVPNYICGDNPKLADLYPPNTFSEVKKFELNGPNPDADAVIVNGPGVYTYDGLKVEAIYKDGEWKYFNWTSSTPIGAVLVKSATCYWVYEYFPGATHGELLTAPNGGIIKEISHAEFGFLSIPEFPLLVCGMLGIIGVLGMVYSQKSRKE
jgi:hypothetical protein